MKTIRTVVVALSFVLLSACASAPSEPRSENGAMTDEEMSAASAAIEAGNVATLKRSFARLPKIPARWKEGDKEYRDQLFATELNRGRRCRTSILDYLVSVGAMTDWNRLKEQESGSSDSQYYEAAFCGKYVRDSYSRQLDREDFQDDNPGAWDALVRTMIVGTHNAFALYTNRRIGTAQEPTSDLDAYLELMRLSAGYGERACLLMKKSSQACPALGLYRRLGAEMKRQDVDKASYAKKWAEISDFLSSVK
jgi:hypothetical protein